MRALAFSFLLGLFLSAVPALAQPYGPPYRGDPREAPRDGVQPLDRLLPGIRREHPGDFYDAEGPTYGPSGDPHYHLKWMTPDGRIEWLDTDARTGRVLGSSPGRDSFDQPGAARDYPRAPSFPTPDMRSRFGGNYERGEEPERGEGGPGGYSRGRDRDYGNDRGEGRESRERRRDR